MLRIGALKADVVPGNCAARCREAYMRLRATPSEVLARTPEYL
jgi:hypothetical protein